MSQQLWEILFLLIILKIPLVWVCWVVWWAIKAEPVVGGDGSNEEFNWRPWSRPPGSRPSRGGPHGRGSRRAARAARSRDRAEL